MNWLDYQRPKSVSEALTLLEQAEGKGRVIAGGTDLVLQLRQGRYQADLLVDITGIADLRQIEEQEGWVHIGAAVTHAEVAQHRLIRKEANALAQGCAQVGSPQIRQMATLVGNIISAQPAADGAIPLLALEAVMSAVASSATSSMAPAELMETESPLAEMLPMVMLPPAVVVNWTLPTPPPTEATKVVAAREPLTLVIVMVPRPV